MQVRFEEIVTPMYLDSWDRLLFIRFEKHEIGRTFGIQCEAVTLSPFLNSGYVLL